jgi:hypothetical protein
MANTKSLTIQNREGAVLVGGAQVMNNPPVGVNELVILTVPCVTQTALSPVATTTTITAVASDTYEIVRVPTNARILSLKVVNATLGTTVTTNFGLLRPVTGGSPTTTGGSATALATGVALGTANATWLEVLGLGGTPSVANMGKTAWELAGQSADPGGEFVVAMTFSAVTSAAAGAVTVQITYTANA